VEKPLLPYRSIEKNRQNRLRSACCVHLHRKASGLPLCSIIMLRGGYCYRLGWKLCSSPRKQGKIGLGLLRGLATVTTPNNETASAGDTKVPGMATDNNVTQENETPSTEHKPAEDWETAMKEKQIKLVELEDKYRRVLAEMENVRERGRRELQQVRNFAIQDFSKQLLEVADILRMALTSLPDPIVKEMTSAQLSPKSDDPKQHKHYLQELYQGVELTERELLRIFKKNGLEVIDPHHQKFDPDAHHALYEVTDASLEPGSVAIVIKKGYSLNGRTLRPAQVGVVKKV
jgi:molecular chaperone GrpE